MTELEAFFTQWVSSFADLLPPGPFWFAFGAGMVSTVNPCGFAMLPAYLGLYLGTQGTSSAMSSGATWPWDAVTVAPGLAQLVRAVLVAGAVTAGFVFLFGGVGILISAGGELIKSFLPWIALSIGVLLALLGIAMLAGKHLSAGFAARLADRLGDPHAIGVRGFFVFGVAFALASLSCTLTIFLTVVGSSLVVRGFISAAVQFVSYALGMGLVILVLTLSMALFKGAVVGGLRAALPYVERVSAVLLVVAGSYIVYYWLFTGELIETFI